MQSVLTWLLKSFLDCKKGPLEKMKKGRKNQTFAIVSTRIWQNFGHLPKIQLFFLFFQYFDYGAHPIFDSKYE